jgi:hypothetical protein
MTTNTPTTFTKEDLHNYTTGMLYDFAGFMTTRESSIKVGSSENASPMVDVLKEFFKLYNIKAFNPDVENWHKKL